ncbi:MAG: hypothetical protein U5K69_18790 [Balneolaceae bacterium]|nr:hypothetical protein [Balneolaceae bacterium]
MTGSGVIDEEGNLLREKENLSEGLTTDEFILSWFQQRVHMFLCSSLFGLKALKEAGGIEKKFKNYDDVAAEFKCAASHGRVDVKPVKARFREHSGSYTQRSGEQELVTWCESADAILELACKLAPTKKEKIMKIGGRSSAERVYRYAAKVDSKIEQLKGYWVVYKYFEYKFPPTAQSWYNIFSFLENFRFLIEPRKFLSDIKNKYFVA